MKKNYNPFQYIEDELDWNASSIRDKPEYWWIDQMGKENIILMFKNAIATLDQWIEFYQKQYKLSENVGDKKYWRKKLAEIIKEYDYKASFLKRFKKTRGKKISQQDIEHARMVPITQYIKFDRNLTTCFWHDDGQPSLRYYPKTNSVYCFACQHAGSSIDIIMVIQNKKFIEAVKELCGKE